MNELTCSILACPNSARKKDLCYAHDRRRRLGKPMETPIRVQIKGGSKCVIEGCETAAHARGHCSMHRRRLRLGQPLSAPRQRMPLGTACSVDGCPQVPIAKDLCAMHHQRKRKHGDTGTAERLMAPAGSGYVNPDGYKVFRINGVDILEHRSVMERQIGRTLRPFETVHHKNGIRHDNAPSNLELWTKPQPAGQRPEDLVAWVLDNYEDLVEQELSGRRATRAAL